MSRKKADDRRYNPEKYQMNFCHECHGLGKTSNKDSSFNKDDPNKVCQVCGGFGLIKKSRKEGSKNDGMVRSRHSRENGNPEDFTSLKILDSCLRRNDRK